MFSYLFRGVALTAVVIGAAMGATIRSETPWRLSLRSPGASALYLSDTAGVPLNSPGIIERSMCLTVNLVKDAAYQCGDVVFTHALPSVRVLGKMQTPVLVYNSQQAVPHPLVTLDIAIPSGTTVPDSISYSTWIGSTQKGREVIPYAKLNENSASRKRIQVGWDAATDSTNIYPITIKARSYYPGDTTHVTSQNSQIILVNRRSSSFGQGWWLGGVEKLYFPTGDSTILWVGADGSARNYHKISASLWRADLLDRPDSLILNAITSKYERRVSGGAVVTFSASGQHVQTIDARGFTTTLAYASALSNATLSSITLPKLVLPYTFHYRDTASNPVVSSIGAPGVSGPRYTTFVPMGRTFSQVFDPAGYDVRYEFDVNVRPIKRYGRAGLVSQYEYDSHAQLQKMTAQMDSGPQVTKICPMFSLDAAAVCGVRFDTPANALVRLDGPRPNALATADTSAFRLGRFGAPEMTRNALHELTYVERATGGCNIFPGFVTKVTATNGLVTTSCPDGNGNPNTVTVLNALGNDVSQVTTYTWDPKWDRVTQIKDNANSITFVASYSSITGNVDSIGDGRIGRATRFNYGAAPYNEAGLLVNAIRPPTRPGRTDLTHLTYDTLGNLTGSYEMTDSLSTYVYNALLHYGQDAIGRTVQSCVEVQRLAILRSNCTYTYYSIAGYDSVITQYADSLSPQLSPIQGTTVRKYHGNEGEILALSRERSGEPYAHFTRFTYDRAQRVTREWTPAPLPFREDMLSADTLFKQYDEAGNLVWSKNRHGAIVEMKYDGLNRLVKRTMPGETFNPAFPDSSMSGAGQYPWCFFGGECNFVIAADVDTFAYDSAGNMRMANNTNSHVYRSYTPNGLLKADTTELAKSGGGFARYIVGHAYDALNRRTDLRMPYALAAGDSTIHFSYNAITNDLNTVTDPLGKSYGFAYNLAGQDTLHTATNAGLTRKLRFDALGNVLVDSLWHSSAGELRRSAFTYDIRGKRLTISNPSAYRDTAAFLYSGLGHLVSSYFAQITPNSGGGTNRGATVELQSYDALGNIYHNTVLDTTKYRYNLGGSSTATGRVGGSVLDSLWRVKGGRDTLSTGDIVVKSYHYDEDGNVTFFHKQPTGSSGAREERYSWYDAIGRLRGADYRTATGAAGPRPTEVFERYEYDALGRRYQVRTDRRCFDYASSAPVLCELSTLRRTLWNGDRELIEIQVPTRVPNETPFTDAQLNDDNFVARFAG